METLLEIVEAEALKLTAGERAALARRLLASLDEDAEIEEAWAAETALAELREGAAFYAERAGSDLGPPLNFSSIVRCAASARSNSSTSSGSQVA